MVASISKKLGTAALTLGLAAALTPMAAFAAGGTVSSETNDVKNVNGSNESILDEAGSGTAYTDVAIAGGDGQIRVSVPTKMVFALNANGGEMTKPTDGTYAIKNKSSFPVYINQVKVTQDEGNKFGLIGDSIEAGTPTTTSGKLADLKVVLTPTTGNEDVLLRGETATHEKSTWFIPKGTWDSVNSKMAPSELTFKILADNSLPTAFLGTNTTEDGFHIEYTIGATQAAVNSGSGE